MTLPLNQGQEAAADGFFSFLLGPEKEMGITGPGGVGKTFLMGHMIDTIMPRYFDSCKLLGLPIEYNSVVMNATTNKAAEVLSYATNRPTNTIHSFMNLKVQEDWSTGRSKLVKTRQWTVHEKKILFVDEASMVDRDLLQTVREGTKDCKIVWIGDHCQLAPVFEKHPPVFKEPISFYELTEQMRTNDPDLQALNLQLRNTVETGDFHPIRLVPGKIILLDDQELQDHIEAVFTANSLDSRILAWSNNRVIQYNDHIRTLRGLPDEYQLGETLGNNSGVQLREGMLSVEAEVTIVDRSATTEKIHIEDGVELEVRRCTLETHIGQRFNNVLLPVDRNHHHSLIAYYKRKKVWNKFYTLKEYPDLRQREAGTVYKAQGSTYDSVYIDLADISRCNDAEQVARMLYVACSRPRHRIYFYGDLAEKYGGLIQ